MKFKVGAYENVPYEEYAEIEAFRSHDLTSVIKCPYTWKNEGPMKETPALIEGRVQHTVFLELDKFDQEFVLEPTVDRRTKAGKEEYEDFKAGIGNRTPIKQDMYDVCMERRAVVSDYVPRETDKVELTLCFYWHNHPFKARMDWYDGKNVWDLKTARDASPRGFRSAINNFNYYMQAALYLDAAKALDMPANQFMFLAQEKMHPYPFAVYTLSPEAVEYGRAKNEQALKTLLECKDKEDYKPYNVSGVQVVELGDLY
jgi:exodeoxyribonuclease VIII